MVIYPIFTNCCSVECCFSRLFGVVLDSEWMAQIHVDNFESQVCQEYVIYATISEIIEEKENRVYLLGTSEKQSQADNSTKVELC